MSFTKITFKRVHKVVPICEKEIAFDNDFFIYKLPEIYVANKATGMVVAKIDNFEMIDDDDAHTSYLVLNYAYDSDEVCDLEYRITYYTGTTTHYSYNRNAVEV